MQISRSDQDHQVVRVQCRPHTDLPGAGGRERAEALEGGKSLPGVLHLPRSARVPGMAARRDGYSLHSVGPQVDHRNKFMT